MAKSFGCCRARIKCGCLGFVGCLGFACTLEIQNDLGVAAFSAAAFSNALKNANLQDRGYLLQVCGACHQCQ